MLSTLNRLANRPNKISIRDTYWLVIVFWSILFLHIGRIQPKSKKKTILDKSVNETKNRLLSDYRQLVEYNFKTWVKAALRINHIKSLPAQKKILPQLRLFWSWSPLKRYWLLENRKTKNNFGLEERLRVLK